MAVLLKPIAPPTPATAPHHVTSQGAPPWSTQAAVPVFVTPEMAREILAGPVMKNRPLRKLVVDRYAKDMTAGKWPPMPEFIAFRASDGALCDGQHRLHAVVKSGVGIWVYIARGLTDEQVAALDRGLSRKVSDVATIVYGVPYAVSVTAQCRVLHYLVTGVEGHEVSGEEVSEAYLAHQEAFDLVNGVAKTGIKCLPAPVLSAVVFAYPRDREAAAAFMSGLATGADLPATSPVLWLRNQLLNKGSLVINRPSDRCRLALISLSAILNLAQGVQKAHHVKPLSLETAQKRYLGAFLGVAPWPGARR